MHLGLKKESIDQLSLAIGDGLPSNACPSRSKQRRRREIGAKLARAGAAVEMLFASNFPRCVLSCQLQHYSVIHLQLGVKINFSFENKFDPVPKSSPFSFFSSAESSKHFLGFQPPLT